MQALGLRRRWVLVDWRVWVMGRAEGRGAEGLWLRGLGRGWVIRWMGRWCERYVVVLEMVRLMVVGSRVSMLVSLGLLRSLQVLSVSLWLVLGRVSCSSLVLLV
jgi:hypothetical protein